MKKFIVLSGIVLVSQITLISDLMKTAGLSYLLLCSVCCDGKSRSLWESPLYAPERKGEK